MKKIIALIAVTLICAHTKASDDFTQKWITDRLSLGLTLSSFSLTDTDRPFDITRTQTFVGYVNKLEESDKTHIYPLLTYRINDYLRLGLTYGKVGARTRNFDPLSPTPRYTHTDGVLTCSGPIFTVEGSYPFLNKWITPHAGLGLALWHSKFSEEAWWWYDYPTEADYKASGSQNKLYGIHYRDMSPESKTLTFFQFGVSVSPFYHVEFDLSYRIMSGDIPVKHNFIYKNHKTVLERSGSFSIDNNALLFSISYWW